MQRQVEESENDRQEAVNWQMKMLHIQQDRDDAKVLFLLLKSTNVCLQTSSGNISLKLYVM